MKRIVPALVLCLSLLAAIPAMADVVVGLPADPVTGNCFPFGCAYVGDYQQVYTSSQFSGTITITDLEFFNTQINTGATTMNSGNWAISLSTTSADWNTLSTTFASNLGADNTLVFNGNLSQPWAFGDTLVINLTTPFTYNPMNGNLLMDVVATGTSNTNGNLFFDTNGSPNPNTFLGRVYCSGGAGGGNPCFVTGTVDNGYGLVTGFSTGTPPVPEPASMFLLGTALAGIAGARRRKLRK